MERFSIKDIVEGLQSIKERMDECGCSDNKEENAVDAALYFISNMTNLQMALYDARSTECVSDIVSEQLCFDDKLGIIVPSEFVKCEGCMFDEERIDKDNDCPEVFKPWLMKKVIE